jgi:hypothetical protein
MKNVFEIIAVALIGYIGSKAEKNNSLIRELQVAYRVYRIDSINTWYLIYARKGDSLYKIVSKKIEIEGCHKIEVGNHYDFHLHSRIYGYTIAGKKILPQNTLLVNCFSFDDSTNICLERDSINDLHYADNIKGLCFIE